MIDLTIRYEWLKKKHTVTSSASRFSRYAESPGNFSIHSVALKDNQVSQLYQFGSVADGKVQAKSG